jgi:hypothetical protein
VIGSEHRSTSPYPTFRISSADEDTPELVRPDLCPGYARVR